MKRLYQKLWLCGIFCLLGTLSFAQQKTITGTVRGLDGNPIAKASVLVKGTNIGEATDTSGDFTIKVNGPKAILTVSSIGHKTKEVTVGKNDHLDIFLEGGAATLSDIVVVGYGTQKKVDATGAVATIDSKILQDRPVTRLSDALQGVVANLNITTQYGGGAPNSTQSFNIRGYTGLGSSQGPLIVIDGFREEI